MMFSHTNLWLFLMLASLIDLKYSLWSYTLKNDNCFTNGDFLLSHFRFACYIRLVITIMSYKTYSCLAFIFVFFIVVAPLLLVCYNTRNWYLFVNPNYFLGDAFRTKEVCKSITLVRNNALFLVKGPTRVELKMHYYL